MFPSVNCVVHSHAESVLPYVSTQVPLVPVFHMAGFLGKSRLSQISLPPADELNNIDFIFVGKYVPVFDIGSEYRAGDQQDMLVRNARFGTALAKRFTKKSLWEVFFGPDQSTETPIPAHNVVLMRRHGYTTHGRDIETAVYRAIYTKINAEAQTKAITLQKAFDPNGDVVSMAMSGPMCNGCLKMNEGTQDKPWFLWKREVENSSLYTNKG
jgi:ribulose-5-phosphate 4-epimerase/fuculose-1-phosphate aldolase